MSIVYTNNLDMHSGGVPLIVHLGQYDSDFSLVFNLYSSVGALTIESGTTAEIRGTKSDGFGYSADATIDIVNKKVTVAGSNQMTAAARQNIFELVLLKNNKVLSSANFILDVEHAALDADTIQDESVLKELNAIIAGAETATQAASAAAESAEAAAESARTLTIDNTLTHQGQAADAKKVGDEITALKDDLSEVNERLDNIEPGLSNEAKAALLACFRHVSFLDDDDDYYGELETALNYEPPHTYSLDAVFTPGDYVVYAGDTLDTLAPYLTVTYYEDSVGTVVSSDDYALSGTLSIGNNTITVSYNGLTATITVTAIDFYNVFRWEYNTGGTGNVKKYNTGTYDKVITVSGSEIAVGILTGSANPSTGSGGTRRTYTTDRGKYPVVVGSTLNPTILYPIPIPPTATKYTATVSVGEICVYIYKYHEDLIDNKYHYERINEAIYGVGSRSENFTAQDNLFLGMMCRMNSSNQTYTTEPVFTLVFE